MPTPRNKCAADFSWMLNSAHCFTFPLHLL